MVENVVERKRRLNELLTLGSKGETILYFLVAKYRDFILLRGGTEKQCEKGTRKLMETKKGMRAKARM